jgi:hypothetical protein
MSWFPINTQKNRGLPINAHPGAFGCKRKFDRHTGIDLYGTPGDWVYAINDGIVVNVDKFTGDDATDWWLPTDAITVETPTENWVYGELKSYVTVGDRVKSGQVIGELVPVLRPHKLRTDIPKHSCTMLHLEKYSRSYEPEMGWAIWTANSDRPSYLLDPTQDLIDILTKAYRKVELLYL